MDASDHIFQQQMLRALQGINEKLGILINVKTEFVWAHICCGKMIQLGQASTCQVCPIDDAAIDFKIEEKNIGALKKLIESTRLGRG